MANPKGIKIQTRRVIKPQPLWVAEPSTPFKTKDANPKGIIKCPYGKPGDILWVRETWRCVKYDSMDGDLGYGVEFKDGTRKYFEFDDNERFHQFGKFAFKEGWRPSIHMPREAARLFLTVKNVRVERLQDISEEDARAEGCIDYHDKIRGGKFDDVVEFDLTARAAFIELWDSIRRWESNYWVWVIEFERRVNHALG